MDRTEANSPDTDICGRCGQLVVPHGNRCPRCGSPMTMRTRRLPILFGIAGVLALAFVIFLMVKVVENEDIESPKTTEQVVK
jgi:hypothetical protein